MLAVEKIRRRKHYPSRFLQGTNWGQAQIGVRSHYSLFIDDQTHHFAAYFSAGINGQSSVAVLHIIGDYSQLNFGDTGLGNSAYNLGGELAKDPTKLNNIGEVIQSYVCKPKGP